MPRTRSPSRPHRILTTAAEYIQPMQPEAVAELPTGPGWQYEPKWDGYRAIAVKNGDEVRLFSRNKSSFTTRYPSLGRQVGQLACRSAVIDGEILALDEQGMPSFQTLQDYGRSKGHTIVLVAFDLLYLDGRSLLAESLVTRQKLLASVVRSSRVQLSEPIGTDLENAIQVAQHAGLEGLVAKKRTSKYQPGVRGVSWFKKRIGHSVEFVVGGFTHGEPFDSILVGTFNDQRFIYAGKVRAGFITATRRELAKRLAPLIVRNCPFVNLPETSTGRWGDGLTKEKMAKCTWVKPKIVVRVSFVEWTDRGRLRHPSFLAITGSMIR